MESDDVTVVGGRRERIEEGRGVLPCRAIAL